MHATGQAPQQGVEAGEGSVRLALVGQGAQQAGQHGIQQMPRPFGAEGPRDAGLPGPHRSDQNPPWLGEPHGPQRVRRERGRRSPVWAVEQGRILPADRVHFGQQWPWRMRGPCHIP